MSSIICVSKEMKYNSNLEQISKPLSEINDINWLRKGVEKLWQLLDNIDTIDDMAKENDEFYRDMVRKQHEKRWNVLVSDGYNLFLPSEKDNIN